MTIPRFTAFSRRSCKKSGETDRNGPGVRASPLRQENKSRAPQTQIPNTFVLKMKPIEIDSNLYLIPLDQNLPGFTSFIGAWLYKGENTFLVDPGPASTISALLEALKTLEAGKPDAILLTHIHLDHAGGIGHLANHFPDTPVVCHESGIPHLVDPSKLWKGSLKTLGKTAETYGELLPVPEKLLVDAAGFHDCGIVPILTPGHAVHHVSYLYGRVLFAGEAGGVYMDIPGGEPGFHLRPATPPRFFMETSIKSVDTLLDTPHDLFCFGHFGATAKTPEFLKLHKEQLLLWHEIIREEMAAEHGDELETRCLGALLKKDPLLGGWQRLSPETRERERFFLLNSIRGFSGYIKANPTP